VSHLELGKAYSEYRKKYGGTQTTLARIIGLSSTYISRDLSMHHNLSEPLKEMNRNKEIPDNAAYFLSTVPNLERQLEVATAVAGSNLGWTLIDQIVREAKAHPMQPVTEILQRAEKESDNARIEKALSVIPQLERKEEARTTIEAYGVNPKLARKIAKAVAQQPERSVQEIVEEIQEAASPSLVQLYARRFKSYSDLCTMIARQMGMMNVRLADLKSLPAESAEGFLIELRILHDTAGKALGRLGPPSETAEAEPVA
ncbi:unnamed protein product, partial [marine sediment metagenome]